MSVQCPKCGANITVPPLATEETTPASPAELPSQHQSDFEPPTERQLKLAKSLGIEVTPNMGKWDLSYEIDAVKNGVEVADRRREYWRRKRMVEDHVDEEEAWRELQDEYILAVYKSVNSDQMRVDILFIEAANIDFDKDCVYVFAVLPQLINGNPRYVHWEVHSSDQSSTFKLPVSNIVYSRKVTRKFRIKGLEFPDTDLYDLKWYAKTIEEGKAAAEQVLHQSFSLKPQHLADKEEA